MLWCHICHIQWVPSPFLGLYKFWDHCSSQSCSHMGSNCSSLPGSSSALPTLLQLSGTRCEPKAQSHGLDKGFCLRFPHLAWEGLGSGWRWGLALGAPRSPAQGSGLTAVGALGCSRGQAAPAGE